MIDWLVGLALNKRLVVAMATVFATIFGVYSWSQLSVDAYPDIADTSAQVITQAPGMAAEEMSSASRLSLGFKRSSFHSISSKRRSK
jgi:cobalt-zinc-cadmium resistance protein CzcA